MIYDSMVFNFLPRHPLKTTALPAGHEPHVHNNVLGSMSMHMREDFLVSIRRDFDNC